MEAILCLNSNNLSEISENYFLNTSRFARAIKMHNIHLICREHCERVDLFGCISRSSAQSRERRKQPGGRARAAASQIAQKRHIGVDTCIMYRELHVRMHVCIYMQTRERRESVSQLSCSSGREMQWRRKFTAPAAAAAVDRPNRPRAQPSSSALCTESELPSN
jgi:hypothetical protein